MATEERSTEDKIILAQYLKQKMELEQDLKRFSEALDEIFKIDPPMKLEPTDKKELDRLSAEIRSAAASNQKRARILELLDKGLGVT